MSASETRPIVEEDLLRYVDGGLSPERRAEVEAHLDTHPEDAARIVADLTQRDQMHQAFHRLSETAMPSTVSLPTLMQRRRARRTAWLGRAAAALLIATAGGVAGWMLKPDAPQLGQGMQVFLTDALNAHRTFVVEVAHPVEVGADQEAHLSTWLTNRLGRPFRVPDLRVADLGLIGGRLLPGPDGPAAQLMYETRSGDRVTLYLRSEDSGEVRFRLAETPGGSAFYWSDNRFAYAITGPVASDRLLEIAHLVQAQLASAGSEDL